MWFGSHGPSANTALNHAGLFQGPVGAILIDCLQASGCYPHPDVFFQLRHPNPMLMQVWSEDSRHIFGDVTPHASFFLRHTAAMNDAAAGSSASGDLTNL